MKLSKQKCVPCEGGMSPMSEANAQKHLREVRDWALAGKTIMKTITFKNFIEAMEFVNRVAKVAEEQGHHPDISISYRKVTFTLWTHAIGGLSINDFIIAAKIDELHT